MLGVRHNRDLAKSVVLCLGIVWAILALSPTVAFAAQGGTYDNVDWNLSDSGELTIGATGQTQTFANHRDAMSWPWLANASSIKSVTFLGTVTGNGSHGFMFYGCSNLASVDVSGFNTDNVTSMENMFGDCTSLTTLDLGSFNVSSVDMFIYMFQGCTSLMSVNMAGWTTKSSANTTRMFESCPGLRYVDLSVLPPIGNSNKNFILEYTDNLTSIKLRGDTLLNCTATKTTYSWCHENDMTEVYTSAQMIAFPSGSMSPGTYYAVYQVAFDPGTGTGTANPVYTPIDTAGSYVLPQKPEALKAPTGMEFDAWDKGAPGTTVSLSGDTTLTATWKQGTYTVTWDVDGTTTSETYTTGQTPTFKGSTGKASDDQYAYSFTGWSPAVSAVTGNQTYTAQYARTAHSWTEPSWNWYASLTAATVSLTCSDCGYHVDKQAAVTSAQTLAPTCVKAGTQTFTAKATVGGTEFTSSRTKDIAALGHAFSSQWSSDEQGHWHQCERCQAKADSASHSWKAPSWNWNDALTAATATLTCSDCGYRLKKQASISSAQTVAPTCTQTGTRTYKAEVTISGKKYTSSRTKDVTALGHDFTAQRHADTEGHWHECSRCQARDLHPHVSGGAATVECAEKCTICGYEISPVRVVVCKVVFKDTGDTQLEALSFKQTKESERTWSVTLPADKPRKSGGYFESWACSQKAGEFKPGETLTFSYDGASTVVFTAQWTPLITPGTHDLAAGRYHLDENVHRVAGDATVYTSDQTVYVPDARQYTFS